MLATHTYNLVMNHEHKEVFLMIYLQGDNGEKGLRGIKGFKGMKGLKVMYTHTVCFLYIYAPRYVLYYDCSSIIETPCSNCMLCRR